MKARLISVLLVIALLVTVGVIAAQAAAKTGVPDFDLADYEAAVAMDFSVKTTYDCPICGGEQTWTAISATPTSALDAGHYYLSDSITAPTDGITIVSAKQVCINLNGKTIEGSGTQVFFSGDSTSNHLNIMGSGYVKNTTDNYVIYGTAGAVRLLGGTYSNAENATTPVVYAYGAGLRRVYVFEGTIVNGTIKAQNATNKGPSIYMHGGYVERVELGLQHSTHTGRDGSELTGSPIIGELVIPSGRAVSISGLVEGASICVNATPGAQITKAYAATGDNKDQAMTSARSDEDVSGFAKYFTAVDSDYKVTASDDGTYLQYVVNTDNAEVCTLCEGVANWSELPDGNVLVDGGHYRLTGDVSLEAALTLEGTACVDLNGNDLTNTSGLVFDIASGKTLYISDLSDSETDGTVSGAGTSDASTIKNAGTLNVYGGIYEHTGTISTIYNTGSFNLHDGTIQNGVAEQGGNMYLSSGTFTMYGGLITGGSATVETTNVEDDLTNTTKQQGGGNIYMNSGEMLLYGGTISNGSAAEASGGNILIRSGRFEIVNGDADTRLPVITGGSCQNYGGNVYMQYLNNGGKIQGEIADGTAGMRGGNLYVNNTGAMGSKHLQITENANLHGGTAKAGGNIAVVGGNIRISGGNNTTISGGTATNSYGGTFYVGGGTIQVLGATVTGGTASRGGLMGMEGGAVQIGGTFDGVNGTFNGGTFTGGKASNQGGMFYVTGGTLDIYNGTYNVAAADNAETADVDESVIASNGGIFGITYGTVTIYGGTFTGGHVTAFGGVAYLYSSDSATLDIQGGTFNEGVAGNRGNTIYARRGTVKLQGGTFNASTSGNAAYFGGTHDKKDTADDYSDDVYNIPKLIVGLAGATVVNENCIDAIDTNALTAVEVLPDYTGTMYIGTPAVTDFGVLANMNKANETETYADKGAKGVSTGEYVGQLLTATAEPRPILPENGGLVIANAKDGENWTTAQAMVDAGKDVTLLRNAALTLADGTTANVDLNGKKINVDGTGTFNGYNSNTSKAGTATLGEGVTCPNADTAVADGDNAYKVVLASETAGTYTYHRLEMRIKSMALKPDQNGMYYTAEFAMDDDLKNAVYAGGIVIGLSGNGYAYDATAIETDYTTINQLAGALTNKELAGLKFLDLNGTDLGSSVNSVLVKNIIDKTLVGAYNGDVSLDNNSVRAEVVLNAIPFVAIEGIDNEILYGVSRSYNLKGFVEAVYAADTTEEKSNSAKLEAYYQGWKDAYYLADENCFMDAWVPVFAGRYTPPATEE